MPLLVDIKVFVVERNYWVIPCVVILFIYIFFGKFGKILHLFHLDQNTLGPLILLRRGQRMLFSEPVTKKETGWYFRLALLMQSELSLLRKWCKLIVACIFSLL